MNNPLKYSNCWEDAQLLTSALQVDQNSDVLSIASGGDNSLYILTGNPKSITCVDTNPTQIALTRIKENAIIHLEYDEFLELLGFHPSVRKAAIFQKIKSYLNPEEIELFYQHGSKSSLVDAGKFETYLRFFAKRVLPLIHNKYTTAKLFVEKDDFDQASFYTKTWNSITWRLFFRIFFSRFVMGRFGREPQKLKEVKVPVSKTIFQRASEHLSNSLCQKNYMLEYIMKGRFTTLPPYARPENFQLIKAWLQRKTVHYHHGDLISALSTGRKYNRYNLSNIFEYMSQEEFERHINIIDKATDCNGIFCYWSLLVERKCSNGKAYSLDTDTEDLGFFYQQFHSYQVA